jgi:hypothetical protein
MVITEPIRVVAKLINNPCQGIKVPSMRKIITNITIGISNLFIRKVFFFISIIKPYIIASLFLFGYNFISL